jgi:hypothetical protein
VDLSDLQPTHTRLPHASRQQLMGAPFRVDPTGVVEDNFSGPTSTTRERLYDGDTAVGPANNETEVIDASDAGTQPRQAWSQDGEQPDFSEQPDREQPDRHEWLAVAIAAAAILVICSTLFVIAWHNSGTPAPSPSTIITVALPPPAPAPAPVPAPNDSHANSAPPPLPMRPLPTSTYPDPDSQLRQYADEDYPVNPTGQRIANFDGPWVPQLSSKHGAQPWTYDKEDGVTYDSELTLQEHQQLRRQYGAKLLWSGDWVTPAGNTIWSHPDYWITIAPVAFPTAASALKWCTSHGLDSDHCDAQNIATGHAAYDN